jgi:probable H4MPT-linked C1 transfer pathway protein
MSSIIGWDVGGVNIKAARLAAGAPVRIVLEPFELQRAPDRLAPTLAAIAATLGTAPVDRHAVTMTAELSQFFRTKREGVDFVLCALETVFGADRLHVFGTDGAFHSVDAARQDPLRVAAGNWMATATLVGRWAPTCLLLDVGSTTTDVIPIVDGIVVAQGRTDPERLAAAELVYTGAVRTPAEAVAHHVPFRGVPAGVSAEGFANMGDVYLWLGALTPEDYTIPSPDGRPATRVFAGERLARVICADREMLAKGDVDAIARGLEEAQVAAVADAVRQVAGRHPRIGAAVVTGLGDFVAAAAARRAGLEVVHLAERLGDGAARTAPAAAVAILLGEAT